jgi:hypothetical protein
LKPVWATYWDLVSKRKKGKKMLKQRGLSTVSMLHILGMWQGREDGDGH